MFTFCDKSQTNNMSAIKSELKIWKSMETNWWLRRVCHSVLKIDSSPLRCLWFVWMSISQNFSQKQHFNRWVCWISCTLSKWMDSEWKKNPSLKSKEGCKIHRPHGDSTNNLQEKGTHLFVNDAFVHGEQMPMKRDKSKTNQLLFTLKIKYYILWYFPTITSLALYPGSILSNSGRYVCEANENWSRVGKSLLVYYFCWSRPEAL